VRKYNSYRKAKYYIFRLLSLKDRSSEEIKGKLLSKGYNKEIVDQLISEFIKKGYINDEKFAYNFSKSRIFGKKYGRKLVEFELAKKGISKDVREKVIEDLYKNISEEELARDLAEKKMKSYKDLPDEVKKRRLVGFLSRRGFSWEIIRKVFLEVFEEVDNS